MAKVASFNWFLGNPARYSLKQRIFNGAAFSSMLICILITIGDSMHSIGNTSAYFTLAPALLFGGLFWYGKVKGANKLAFTFFALLGLGGVFYDWAFFYGFSGSSLIITMLIAALIPAFFKGRMRILMICLTFAFVSILYFVELNGVFDTGAYNNKTDRITDLFMTTCFMMIGMLILVAVMIESYDQQKRLALSLNKKLEARNQNLKQDIELKDKFLSIISHDLRGPVGALSGLSDILEEETNLDKNTSESTYTIVNSMKTSSKQALQLLDNLLYWARAESGELKPIIKDEIIENCIDENLKLFQSNISLKQLQIKCKYTSKLKAKVDKSMLDLIIRNLISNAVKFTPNNGHITIETGEKNSAVFFSISDSGIGINEKTLKSIFQLDNRNSTYGTNSEKGTGLGLKLCRQFIELINGEILVESKVGRGTAFTVYLKKGTVKEMLN
ncbi:MAG: sensor histidine kinase [Bacteroidia bacterium]